MMKLYMTYGGSQGCLYLMGAPCCVLAFLFPEAIPLGDGVGDSVGGGRGMD